MARHRARSEPRRVSLGDDLRIARAREVWALLSASPAAREVEIDASQVGRVDAAGLQALAAGVAALGAAKVRIRWSAVSPVLEASIALTGFASALEMK